MHYQNPNGIPNQYQSAISSVGGILEHYDSDKLIAAFGFGGIPSYTNLNQVSHCFHLNGLPQPECNGIQGLMDAYAFSLNNVRLYGPTYFAPCLEIFINFVNQNLHKKLYHIMLIITDGDIHDMARTKELIAEASSLPVSIIIVGVGNASFELMVELDGDDESQRKLDSNSPPFRDIVQFVKFSDFKNSGSQSLSEEVLREVPDQVIEYLASSNRGD